MDETQYAMFSKPGTRLTGGVHRVEEGKVVKVKVDDKGEGEATNRITWRVEDVSTTLASIQAAGGEVVRYVRVLLWLGCRHVEGVF
jgi:predicted enzyme related to lactoylglutathione lyase